MRLFEFFLITVAVFLFLITQTFNTCFAGYSIPQLLNYQGFLVENSQPLNGNVSLTFSLYHSKEEGTPLWSEIQNVNVNQGRFSVLLGGVDPENNSLPFAIFEKGEIYIGVKVEDNYEMTPRQQIVSVPYAMFSSNCNAIESKMFAGEVIDISENPLPVYLDSSDQRIRKCKSNDQNKTGFLGFAISTAAKDELVDVQYNGIVEGFSNLETGESYFVSSNGGIGTNPGNFFVFTGTAVSPTSLLIMNETLENSIIEFVASDNLKLSADSERMFEDNNDLEKVKEIKVNRGGSIRIKFELKVEKTGFLGFGFIMKNGVDHVVYESSTNNTSYKMFSTDVNVSAGDHVQLFLRHRNVGWKVFTRNFRVYYDIVRRNNDCSITLY